MFGNGIVEMGGGAYVRFDQAEELLAAKEAERAEQWRLRREMEADRDTQKAIAARLENELAAERAEKERLAALLHDNGTPRFNAVCERAEKAEDDNAAKDARVKELEQINANLMGDDENKPRYTTKRLKLEIARATEALEAKLSAAEKALEPFADHAKDRAVDAAEWRNSDTVQIVVTIGDLRKARAVLGGKPS